jgi:4-diphosphocytidyl-2-C-methyl-D-erythritol kinase
MKASETLRAPAKLNLTLEVLGRRADGYHSIRSVMVPVDLCDEIDLRIAPGGFTFACSGAVVEGENLVERAVRMLDLPSERIHIELRKHIPMGAGMGGGSSDAAAIVLAAQRGFFSKRAESDDLAIARALGSDVPFFLVQTGALVEGTGERITALGAMPPWHAIVIKPPVAISTAQAYRRIDEAGPRETRSRSASIGMQMAEALQRAQFDRVVDLLQNDFHEAFARQTPEIALALTALESAGARKALMTGSGSCVFALARNGGECRAIAQAVRVPAGFALYTCRFTNGSQWRSAA